MDFDPGPDGFNVVKGVIHDPSAVTANPDGKAKIISDNYAHTVAHEMLHCCNIKHHGDIDLSGLLIGGKYLADSINRNNINVEPDRMYLIINGKLYYPSAAYSVHWQSGLPMKVEEVDTSGIQLFIGRQGGQHSGFEDCIMRYNAANSYIDTNKELWMIDQAEGYHSELAGIQLCTGKTGTGVNAPPHSRYGDATVGNCKSQFCINDKYH